MRHELSNRWVAMTRWKGELAAIALVVVFVGIAAYGVYQKTDRTIATLERTGILEALHQSQGNTGSNFSIFYVRLENNELVTVNPPEMTPFRKSARVRILEATKESGRKSYAYIGYVDAASNPTSERER